MKRFFAVCVATIAVFLPTGTMADECRDGLRPNVVRATMVNETALAWLYIASEEEFQERKRSGNGSLGIGKLSASFDSDSSQSSRRNKLEQMGYRLNERQSIDYFASTLSDQARRDFFKCVQGKDKPFFLDWTENGRHGDGTRSIRLEFRYIEYGTDPKNFKRFNLKWMSQPNKSIGDELQKRYSRVVSPTTVITAPIGLAASDSIDVTVERLVSDGSTGANVSIFIPPVPIVKLEIISPWLQQVYSIPILVKTHRPNIADQWHVTNFNPDLQPNLAGKIKSNDFIPASGNQEIVLAWEKEGRAKLPPLTDDELNFEYRCGFNVSPLRMIKFKNQRIPSTLYYPSSTTFLPAGQLCGNERHPVSEPIMTFLAVRLLGSRANEFRVKLNCRVGSTWSNVSPEEGCDIPTGITDFRIEIDSRGPG